MKRCIALFAIALDPANLWYLTDAAISFKYRGRDAKANKAGDTGVPAGMADLGWARALAKRADAAYAAMPAPTAELKGKFDAMKAQGL